MLTGYYLALFLISILVLFIIWIGSWLGFISSSLENTRTYGWGSYKKFIGYFYDNGLYENQTDIGVYKTYVDTGAVTHFGPVKKESAYCSKDAIIFDRKCMLLLPIAYLRYLIFIYFIISTKSKYKKIKW